MRRPNRGYVVKSAIATVLWLGFLVAFITLEVASREVGNAAFIGFAVGFVVAWLTPKLWRWADRLERG